MREKLVELLYKINDTICSDLLSYEREEVADCLLEKGVVVLPVKPGDEVWRITTNYTSKTKKFNKQP